MGRVLIEHLPPPSIPYSELLSDWLSNHIIEEDILMKPMLQTYPYDFKPAECHPASV